jgi:serine/threonine protein kinase
MVNERPQAREIEATRPPVTLGRHQLMFAVGHGGMSDVYLALVSSAVGVHKLLVVKQLRAALLDEPEALSMFMDEARLAARLHHPNVVSTFEVGQQGPIPYITMEFLDGQPLHRVVRRLGVGSCEDAGEGEQQPLSLAMRLRIVTEMLDGLHYAHELRDYDGSPLRVVHRDVSPQNLFITYDGQIKLVDFGIAKASGSITHTEGRGLKGKLAYMSPQQAAGEPVDRRADVFAAGVILWELLSGRRLWAGCSEAVLARRLVDQQLPELGIPGIPAPLLAICRKAMAPALAERFASADAFRLALERFMITHELQTRPRAIGERVAEAFAEQRIEIRKRIDELLSQLDTGGSASVSGTDLWRASQRGTPLPASSSETSREDGSDYAAPDEVTADYGPAAAEPVSGAASRGQAREDEPSASSSVRGEIGALRSAPRGSTWTRTRAPGAWLLAGGLTLAAIAALAWLPGRRSTPAPEPSDTDSSGPDRPDPSVGPPPPALPSTPGQLDADDPCGSGPKPRVRLSGEIDVDATLTCDREYLLAFTTRIAAGVTLTIEAGTTLYGDRETKGVLVVQPGARLIAEGTRERPIVFTSEAAPGEQRPGDWGGVIVLGRAPINLRNADGEPMRGQVEGLSTAAPYGGDDPDDDSGVLRYVRIEYPGSELAPANEINGLTLAGVGRGTVLDHIQVRATTDDCFEFFGGTVDGRYLICDSPGDDGFDFDHGYQGRLQFLVVRDQLVRPDEDPSTVEVSHAIEADNEPNGTDAEPRTRPEIWNFTACGLAGSRTPSFAMLARRSAQPRLGAAYLSGFDYALEVRDIDTSVTMAHVVLVDQPAAIADELPDDDGGFDELAWLADPTRSVQVTADRGPSCEGPAPASLFPTERAPGIVGELARPPADGWFEPVDYVGAFAGPDDDWSAGWTVF